MRGVMGKAIVVGSINRDIVAYVPHHPRPGETVLTSRGALFAGGKGANQAVAIARLDGSVKMWGRVGNDAFGAEMRTHLASEGVDTGGIESVAAAPTGIALITVDAQGQNAITVVSGANQLWGDAHIALGAGPQDIVVCQLEIALPIVAESFRQARAAGARTVLNAAPYQPLDDQLLATTDILIVNELELAAFAGAETSIDHDDLARLSRHASDVLARGPSLVVVTLGADGVYLQGTGVQAECIPSNKVVARDTTGAGDCFVGAFVAELLRGQGPQEAAVFANAAAAISVTRDGAAASLPRRAEVARFLGTGTP